MNNPQNPLSGNEYRAIVHDAEVAMAQQVIDLRNTPEFKEVPLTEEERKTYYGGRAKPETNPEDLYINSYYLISDLATKSDGTVDYETLYAWRRKLKQISDPTIVAKAQEYIDRDKDKSYLQAQQVMEKLQQMPKYIGTTKERSDDLSKALNLALAEIQYLPPGFPKKMQYGISQVYKKYGNEQGALAEEAYVRGVGDALGVNKERKAYASQNQAILMRWYSDAVFMDMPELVEAGVQPVIPKHEAPISLPVEKLPAFQRPVETNWPDLFLRAIGR
jgi:hypothetical protein